MAGYDDRAVVTIGEFTTKHVASIRIDHAKFTEDVTDFRLYVRLADLGAEFWAAVADGGGDIRVYAADGTTELAREVVSCDTATQTGELWVLVPAVSSTVDTVVYIRCGTGAADYAVDATYGKNAVWPDLVSRYRMDDDAASTTVVDDMGGFNATATFDTDDNTEAGKLGKALNFEFDDGDLASRTGTNYFGGSATACTFSVWVKQESPQIVGSIFQKRREWSLRADGDTHFVRFRLSDSSTDTEIYYANAVMNLPNGEWSHLVGTWDANGDKYLRLYYNGNIVGTSSLPMNSLYQSTNTLYIASNPYGVTQNFDGAIDDLAIYSVAKSPATIAAEYANQSDPTTFYTVSDDGMWVEVTAEDETGEEVGLVAIAEDDASSESLVTAMPEADYAGEALVTALAYDTPTGEVSAQAEGELDDAGEMLLEAAPEAEAAGEMNVEATGEDETSAEATIELAAGNDGSGEALVEAITEGDTAGETDIVVAGEENAEGEALVAVSTEDEGEGEVGMATGQVEDDAIGEILTTTKAEDDASGENDISAMPEDESAGEATVELMAGDGEVGETTIILTGIEDEAAEVTVITTSGEDDAGSEAAITADIEADQEGEIGIAETGEDDGIGEASFGCEGEGYTRPASGVTLRSRESRVTLQVRQR